MGDDSDSQNVETPTEVKIDKWDGSAVKNSLDDTVKKIFVSKDGRLKYTESHLMVDLRLGICLTAVGAAMFALAWDYLHPFPASKPILIACVLSYFVLMMVLTIYTTFVEKGIFLKAIVKDPTGVDRDRVWTVSSCLKRFDDIYHLCIEYRSSSGVTTEANLSKSIANWFDTNGLLMADKFESEVLKLHDSLTPEKKNK